MWEGVGDRTELQHIDPHSIGHNHVSFPFSWTLWDMFSFQHLLSNSSDPQLVWSPNWLIGGLRASSAGCWLSLTHLVSNWLNFLCSVLYNSSTPTFFLWASQLHSFNPSTVKVIILIFLNRMHLLFTRVHFLFWQPGRVVGQYTTESGDIKPIYYNKEETLFL